MTKRRMKYSEYKKHYADCDTVCGSYDKYSRTIEVEIPEGRMKPSGVRDRHFAGYILFAKDSTGKIFRFGYRAVSMENANKALLKDCKKMNLTPCEEPEGCGQTIFF